MGNSKVQISNLTFATPNKESGVRIDPNFGFKHGVNIQRIQNLKDTGDFHEQQDRRVPLYQSRRALRLLKDEREKLRIAREKEQAEEFSGKECLT